MLDKLLNRLTDNYNKNHDSNIGKLFSVISDELLEIQQAYIDIKIARDIDEAKGKTLDRIGNNVLEYRNEHNDDEYKQWIKIKILANRSDGSMPLIIQILKTYMGDDFVSIEDGWNSYVEEPASMVVNIRSTSGNIPHEVLKRIKSAGVRVYFTAGSETSNIILDFRAYSFEVPYKICNRFRTDDMPGLIIKVLNTTHVRGYSFNAKQLRCNEFIAGSFQW